MVASRKADSGHDISEAMSKLGRLLETEDELEAMLEVTERDARELVEAARMTADARLRQLELQLEDESRRLRERVARDRDVAIELIQEEARQETKRFDELDDAEITMLARHVVALLVEQPDPGDPR